MYASDSEFDAACLSKAKNNNLKHGNFSVDLNVFVVYSERNKAPDVVIQRDPSSYIVQDETEQTKLAERMLLTRHRLREHL